MNPKLIVTAVLASLLSITGSVAAQAKPKRGPEDESKSAAVEIRAFVVRTFTSLDSGRDFANFFHGDAAENVPYGDYRIEVSAVAHYSERRFVGVYQKKVIVIVGLEFGHEVFATPLDLHGRVNDLPASAIKASFVKLVGLYSSTSWESAITPDGSFEMSGMGWGKYLLLVVGENGVLASRIITIPDIGLNQTVIIEIGQRD
jgi:hypothetical protein